MYSIKREEDIPHLLKFHRAKDMVNIMKYFPDLSPVDDLAVVVDEEDYLKHQEELGNLTSIRNGNPTTEPCMKSIPVKELHPNIIEVLSDIKKENPKGVIILFHLNVEATERYGRYAGISLGVSLGNSVYIDAVSRGFDGREVLKGISCHERYQIPWTDLRRINIDNFHEYQTFRITEEAYQVSREERISFLESCSIAREVAEENVPVTYQDIPDFIWLDIIKNILKVLEKEEDILRNDGFLEFNLSGHTEGKRFRPWQMVDDQRM